jgi:P27 family predicted phage terminase small subunit
MGLRGPLPKPDDRRQRRNRQSPLVLRSGSRAPEPPQGLLKIWTDRWRLYWKSELAQATRDAHLPLIERLFFRYDERERAYRTVRRHGRLSRGSQGQLVAHPLLKYIDACDAEIRQLEDRLGLSPKSMAQLGSSFAHAQKSLDDLNDGMEQDNADDSDADPRLEVIG